MKKFVALALALLIGLTAFAVQIKRIPRLDVDTLTVDTVTAGTTTAASFIGPLTCTACIAANELSFDPATVTNSQDTSTLFTVTNASAGVLATAGLRALTAAGGVNILARGANYSGAQANSAVIETVGTSKLQVRVGAAQVLEIDTNNQLFLTGALVFGDCGTAASAASLGLDACNQTTITGSTQIDTINTCDTARKGRRMVVLCGTATALLSESGNMKLAGTGFTCGTDDSLNLLCDGASWIELSRSVN